jgi:RHS repeat-associated protein
VLRDEYQPDGLTLIQRLYVQQDANGDVTSILDSKTGAVQERFEYDPYGSVTYLDANWNTQESSPSGWQMLHQALRLDATTGWYDNAARDLIPAEGRFAERDPLGLGGADLNLYRYEGTDPVDSRDPLGLRTWWGKATEALRGVWEVGPIDAWNAGYGEIGTKAQAYSERLFPHPTRPGVPDKSSWQRNAARHGYWMAMLAAVHGKAKARAIGNAHEYGSEDPLDTWVDQYNNERAREIGRSEFEHRRRQSKTYGRRFSWGVVEGNIELSVDIGLSNGLFITDPYKDTRIPKRLRPVPGGGNNYDPGRYGPRYTRGKYEKTNPAGVY